MDNQQHDPVTRQDVNIRVLEIGLVHLDNTLHDAVVAVKEHTNLLQAIRLEMQANSERINVHIEKAVHVENELRTLIQEMKMRIQVIEATMRDNVSWLSLKNVAVALWYIIGASGVIATILHLMKVIP